jgi:fructose-1,6-bisphosphatase-3
MDNYQELLFEKYDKSRSRVLTELMNLRAIQKLPKGTELFLSDIHGAFEPFDHILRTGAGNLRGKISDCFGTGLSRAAQEHLTMLVAYPQEVLERGLLEREDFFQTCEQLLQLINYTGSKYSRLKVRKRLPKEYRYVLEEFLYADEVSVEKLEYRAQLLESLFESVNQVSFFTELGKTVQSLVIDHIHLVGDVFDRGSGADKIMDKLLDCRSVDFQWGNHDVLWMGAYFGSYANLVTLLRIAARYDYLYDIERAYGLNLRPLFFFAEKYYHARPDFSPKSREGELHSVFDRDDRMSKVHQALSILQFKLEGQIIDRRPEFEMADRNHLKHIDPRTNRIMIDDVSHQLSGFNSTQINWSDPNALTSEEEYVLEALMTSFQNSEKLQRQMTFLLDKGTMYRIYNGNLLFHGCLPMSDNGEFVPFMGYAGRDLLDRFNLWIHEAARKLDTHDDFATDMCWYAWVGKLSPLFGRSKMTTFERYYVTDKSTYPEGDNPYFDLRVREDICQNILRAFDLPAETASIINGHTPVKVKDGELPIKANGRLIVIDGGMSHAYQKTTGIAGYSLLNNSYGFQLVTHQVFKGIQAFLDSGVETTDLKEIIPGNLKRRLIEDTTIGQGLTRQIMDLEALLSEL